MRILRRTLLLLVWMLIGILMTVGVYFVLSKIYSDVLFRYIPKLFPLYNPVLEKELYLGHVFRMNLVSLSVSVFLSVYLSLRYDNERDEYLIGRTDGFCTVNEVIPSYRSRFLISDTVACVISAAALSVPFAFIPEKFLNRDSFFPMLLRTYHQLNQSLGTAALGLVKLLALLLSHIAAVPLAMKRWRAKWLTGFAESSGGAV